jgi:penicillin amidase
MPLRSRIFLGASSFLLAIVLALAYWTYHFVTKSFPEYDGSESTPAVRTNVEILSDDYGVPHIRAQSEEDAYVAVGFLHAQQRMWQMELMRRVGQGRLSEILGEPALKTDKLFRTLNLHRTAHQLTELLDPPTRSALEAYARGVNAFLESHRSDLAIEFDLLNIIPEPWQIEHSLLITRLMAWELNHARWVDLLQNKLVQKFGEAKARELFPGYPPDGSLILKSFVPGARSPKISEQLFDAERSYATLMGFDGMESGSNSWVVSASKSTTGKPILANDPHLMLLNPARWFELHVSAPGLNVSGTTIAGIPFVVIGHNERIAWGLTNAMFDDEDFYIEQVDSLEHPTQYRFNNEWRKVEEAVDTIVVKDAKPVFFSIYRTHRGPIVNKIEAGATNEANLISMRWMGHELTEESDAFYKINRAQNWEEFEQGVRLFSVPAQNFVFADVDGNIGFHTGGRLPIVKARGATLPFPGWTDEFDWKNFVPFNQMPNTYNPAEGFVATANNKPVGDEYPFYISNNWEPSWRADRITEFLSELPQVSIDDTKRLQNDLVSLHARALVPLILHAFEQVEVLHPDVKTALSYFRNWNFEMRPEDVSTTLFQSWFVKVVFNTLHDELGSELFGLYDTLASTPLKVITAMLADSTATWFDNIGTETHESRDDIVRKSLVDAIQSLKGSLGGELKEWQWQRLHKLTFTHVFGENAMLKSIFNRGPFPTGGSHSTVNVGYFRMSNPFKHTVGASTRQIFDLSNWDNSRAVTAPGQSGHPYEKHFDDQTKLWLNGAYRTMPFSREAVDRECKHRFILRPKN